MIEVKDDDYHEERLKLTGGTANNILKIVSPDKLVEMLILPDELEWPSFYPSKQESAFDKFLFFHRALVLALIP